MKQLKHSFILALTIVGSLNLLAQGDKTDGWGSSVKYENRLDIPAAPNCNPSEVYLKKKVKAEMAKFYKDYPLIAIDFTSFKGQKGYSDRKTAGKIVYPYKIEFFIYAKRKLVQDGKELTEYSTWEHDAVYEYSTKPGKKCEFTRAASSDSKLVKREVY